MADGARGDALLPRVARALGLRIIAPMAGGEFGATLVADNDGRELVLKVMASPAMAAEMARGASMAERLRARGYPAPHYAGTGVACGASWSLQERLPGQVPDMLTVAHARRLIELAEMHAGAAPEGGNWDERTRVEAVRWSRTAASHEAASALGAELSRVIEYADAADLLHDGVMHCDFHHRNYLADGDEVTGVFDWDLATAGDWRFDLFTLAFWTSIHRVGVEQGAREMIVARMHDACPAPVLAFFAACQSLRQLDFDVRAHPERVSGLVTAIEATISPWWCATE